MVQFVGINTTYGKSKIWYLHSTVVTLVSRFENFEPSSQQNIQEDQYP